MQRNDLVQYCKLILGTDDYVIFEDAGYSGKNTDRPMYQSMLNQIRSGLFTHVLVWKLDRISRNLLDFASMYSELKSLGVTFVSKNEQFDTSTAMGEAMLKIILVFAELERNMTSERVTATMISRASQGQWNGGRIPFGYAYDRETSTFSIDDNEAAVVRRIFDDYEKLKSLTILARRLNASGYRTRANSFWSPASLYIILHNVFYVGDYRYNVLKEGDRQRPKPQSEWVTVPDHHVAIISREQHKRVELLLASNDRRAKERNIDYSPKHTHVFGGMVICGECNRLMTCTPMQRGKKPFPCTRYTCSTRRKLKDACSGVSVTDITIGEFAINYILNMLNLQKTFVSSMTLSEIEAALLRGSTFSYIDHIDEQGLTDLYGVLSSGILNGPVYGRGYTVTHEEAPSEDDSSLKKERAKIERALERLQNLFLYSDDSMSESEYVIKRSELVSRLEEVNEQIGIIQSAEWHASLSDETFVQKASEFIISKNLEDRNYIYYERLASEVDEKSLKAFFVSVIDNIVLSGGKIVSITFRNGLSHSFTTKKART